MTQQDQEAAEPPAKDVFLDNVVGLGHAALELLAVLAPVRSIFPQMIQERIDGLQTAVNVWLPTSGGSAATEVQP